VHFFLANNNRKCGFEELRHWFGGRITLERLLARMMKVNLLTKDTGGAFCLSDRPPEEARAVIDALKKSI